MRWKESTSYKKQSCGKLKIKMKSIFCWIGQQSNMMKNSTWVTTAKHKTSKGTKLKTFWQWLKPVREWDEGNLYSQTEREFVSLWAKTSTSTSEANLRSGSSTGSEVIRVYVKSLWCFLSPFKRWIPESQLIPWLNVQCMSKAPGAPAVHSP